MTFREDPSILISTVIEYGPKDRCSIVSSSPRRLGPFWIQWLLGEKQRGRGVNFLLPSSDTAACRIKSLNS
jgi:hypothetical protein